MMPQALPGPVLCQMRFSNVIKFPQTFLIRPLNLTSAPNPTKCPGLPCRGSYQARPPAVLDK